MATSVTFVDSRVSDLASISSGGLGDGDWYILSPDEDGVVEMRRILAGYADLDAIHVVSHGSTGALLLGRTWLDTAGLVSHAADLAEIGASLSETGDLLLYGCDVACGDAGPAFVEELARLTGAAVAASSNATGAAALGGDWRLKVASGPIEAITLDGGGFAGLLAGATVSVASSWTYRAEGFTGSVPFTFIVTRTGDTSTTESVDWTVAGAGPNPATAGDFVGGVLPGGTVTFTPGETSKTISVAVQADSAAEPEEGFTVGLSNASAGMTIDRATASATIIDEVGTRFVVSIDPVALLSNSSTLRPIFSPDGLKVAFQGYADNLVPNDTNDDPDFFVKDLMTGAVVRVSTDSAGGQADGDAQNNNDPISFSPDSTKVVFGSLASNLVPGDTNGKYDIFVKDLTTGATTRVSTDSAGVQGDDHSHQPMFSPDGTKVVFWSSATNLVSGDTNGKQDIFIKDLTTGAITRVSTDAAGAQANGQSDQPIFSPDGTKVAFISTATNLVPVDTNGAFGDLFIKDLISGAVVLLSTDSAGVQASLSVSGPKFSPDGTKVLFSSTATNLVTGDTNSSSDIFVKDLITGTVVRASTDAVGGQANGGSFDAVFSPDGTRVSFYSGATNLVAGDTNAATDIFVKDLTTGALQRVSTNAGGVQGDKFSVGESNFSPDGTRLIITSDASNLVTGDTNGFVDAFIADLNLVSVTATDAARAEGPSGTTLFSFTVSRTGVIIHPLSVDWSVTGTGVHPADVADFGGVLPSGTVFLAGSEPSTVVTVAVAGDTAIEFDETFSITLSNLSVTDFMLGTKTATGVIRNDDKPVAAIAADATSHAEGNGGTTTFTFTVALDRTGPFPETVDWAVTGSGANPADGTDFGGVLPSGTLTFGVGETTKTITLDVTGDTAVEANEAFKVTLANPSSGLAIGTNPASAAIENDDFASVSVAALSAAKAEENSGIIPFTFTVTLSQAGLATQTVDWTVTGTGEHAADGADFVGGALPSGTVTFAAGETTQTITLPVLGDTVVEFDDFFLVTLSNPSPGLALGTASALGVAQNDDRAKISIAPLAASKAEGDSGTSAFTFSITLDQASFAEQVADWAVTGSDGNPAAATDFGGAFPAGKVTFAIGETSKDVTVLVSGDTTAEFNEDFAVTLSNLTFGLQMGTASATGSILNDDKSVVSVTAGPGSKAEGTGPATAFNWTVSLDRAGVASQTVAWAVTGGGAHAADAADLVDGVLPSGTLTFAPGETTKTVTIDVLGDATVEFDEGVVLILSDPSSGLDLGTATMAGTIVNDDLSVVSIAAQSASKAEGNGGTTAFTFTVGLSQAGVASQTVGWSVIGTGANAADAADFGGALPAGTVTFAAGETSQVVIIQVSGDTVGESNETFLVNLSSPSSGLEFGTASAGGTILDDDASVSIAALAATKAENNSGTTAFTFTVTTTGDSSASRTVGWAVSGSGTGKADGTDFVGGVLPTGTLTFAAGETSKVLTINVAGDTTVELDEGFAVTLSNPPPGWKLGTDSASGSIQNDDVVVVTVTTHDDAYIVLEGQSLSIGAAASVLVNDQSASSATLLTGASHGTLQLAGTGGFTYSPAAGFTGIDSFTYHAVPGGNGVDGKAMLYVVPVNVGASTTLDLLALSADEQIAATYVAFFGRAADALGFGFWVDQFNTGLPTQGPAKLFANIASSFGVSAEAKALYPFLDNPFGATDGQISAFLDSVYNNLFNRSSDALGLAYWTGQIRETLQAGQFVGSVLVNIMSGAQDTAAGKDITTLMGKVAVSLEYVREQEAHHTVWAGASDVAAATSLLDPVASDTQSVLIGVKNAETLIANHA